MTLTTSYATLTLEDRITGALVGAAVGDALGGPVEGYTPEQIVERHGGRVHGIVGPWHGDEWRTARPIAPYHKGDGHITDDTLMTHTLIRVYERVRDHLDAYAIADHLVPDLISRPLWIPELEAETIPLHRVFLAEKWIVARLHYGHVDPREAGTGNIVNCGAAMYMAPVGLVNAANPAAAYTEALEVAAPHQSSYGREAAGVFAAAVAAACAPAATAAGVVETCLSLAKDGTRAAIEAVAEAASGHTDFESALAPSGRRSPLRHGRPGLPRPVPGRPPPVPPARHRGAPDRPGNAARRRRRLPHGGTRRGELRPGLRLHRDDGGRTGGRAPGRGPHPRRLGQTGRRGQPPGPARPARALTEVTREVYAKDRARQDAHRTAFEALTR